jgi:DNA-directed RNA polymerase specialized sigma24 family protein
VPEPATPNAERKALARESARRRQVVATLRLAEAVAGYAADQAGNGLGPEEARAAAIDAAGELAEMAATLRRLTRLGPSERRVLAVQLSAFGWTRHEVARRLGVSERAVWNYLRPGDPAGETG